MCHCPGITRSRRWLDGDENAAFFETSPGSDGRRAVVKVVREAVVDGNGLLDLWQRTRQLRHPNLIELFEFGRADHGGEIVLYAVFESPDDTLASALARGRSIHRNRAKSSIRCSVRFAICMRRDWCSERSIPITSLPSAIGSRSRTDALRDADTSSAYREDVRLLGELWQRDLMSASPKSSQIAAHAADPNPQSRWTLAEISAALDPPIPAVQAPAPPSCRPRFARLRFWHLRLSFARRRPLPNAPPRIPSRNGFSWAPPECCCSCSDSIGDAPPRSRRRRRLLPSRFLPKLPRPHRCRRSRLRRPRFRRYRRPSPAAGKEMWRVIAFTYRTRACRRQESATAQSVSSRTERRGIFTEGQRRLLPGLRWAGA